MAQYEVVSLCKYCLDREGIRSRSRIEQRECNLCNGLLSNLEKLSEDIVRKLSDYEFDTFLVGATVPQVILDREDELRSKLKIKGRESIKSQITRILSKNVASRTNRKVDFSRPDVTVVVSIADSSIDVNARSVWLSAKYRKLSRGISQRETTCRVCNGLGCADCNYGGKSSKSIQSIVSKFLVEKFQAESCNFVWLGSEDENSLVEGSGRPFYVEILRPKKRLTSKGRARFGTALAFKSNDIELTNIMRLERRVTEVPQFDIVCRINMIRKEGLAEVPDLPLKELQEQFSNAIVDVRLSRKFRLVQRRIRSISITSGDGHQNLQLSISCEGGIPLKKLVSGQNNDVEPNLSVLTSAYEIDPMQPFDILDIKMRKAKGHASDNGGQSDKTMLDETVD